MPCSALCGVMLSTRQQRALSTSSRMNWLLSPPLTSRVLVVCSTSYTRKCTCQSINQKREHFICCLLQLLFTSSNSNVFRYLFEAQTGQTYRVHPFLQIEKHFTNTCDSKSRYLGPQVCDLKIKQLMG